MGTTVRMQTAAETQIAQMNSWMVLERMIRHYEHMFSANSGGSLHLMHVNKNAGCAAAEVQLELTALSPWGKRI